MKPEHFGNWMLTSTTQFPVLNAVSSLDPTYSLIPWTHRNARLVVHQPADVLIQAPLLLLHLCHPRRELLLRKQKQL